MKRAASLRNVTSAAAIAAMLAACSGGHSGVLPAPAQSSKPAGGTAAKATMIVKIPAHKASQGARKTAYISPSTQSIGFSYFAGTGAYPAPQNANVTPGSPGCTTDSSGDTTCSLTFGAVAGNISYTVTAYDGANGSGNVLGSANAEMSVTAGKDNQFTITLDGVPAKYAVTPARKSVPAGTPADVPVSVAAYDTDGNLIVNSPQLQIDGTPSISTNDATEFSITQNGQTLTNYQGNANAFVLSQPFTGIVVHYNGGLRENDSLTFSDGTITANGSIDVAKPSSTASLVFGTWYYFGSYNGGEDSSGIDGLPGGATGTTIGVTAAGWGGNQAGTCTPGGAETYSEITADANNNLAFAATSPCSGGGIPGEPAIVDQTPGASSPNWTITGLGQDFYLASFGFDSTNAPYLWLDLGNQTVGGVTADHAEIVVLKPGSNGAYSAAMVARSIDYVGNPETMLVAPDGTIYAAHVGDVGNHVNSEAIDVFAPGANGSADTTAPPTRYIGGALTGLASIKQMALDSKGNLYVANAGNGVDNGSITVFAPGASGDVSPIRTIQGSSTGIAQALGGIGIDAFDNLYALANGQFVVFASGAAGNATPSRTFGMNNFGLSGPMALLK